MRVSHLSLTDFRNYPVAEVDFGPGSNLIVGRNGQGKTNLVEAVGYLSTLKSHRVPIDLPLIRAGRDAAMIRAILNNGERELLVEVQINRTGQNQARLNRGVVRPREVMRYCHSVLFAPEDLALVRGEPSARRRFLDDLLVQVSPRLAGVMADYDRVVRQRNTLLKSARMRGSTEPATLDVWDERLVTLGSEIIAARSSLTDDLRGPATTAYRAVAGTEHVPELAPQLSILSDDVERAIDDIPGLFRDALTAVRRQEIERAVTLVGPHRDDLTLILNGLPARGYASHGESWSFALALRLAAAEVLRRDVLSGDPVIMLDDVFAELDQARRARLADAVSGFEQVLVTAAVREDVPDAIAGRTVRIEGGVVLDD